MRGFELHSSAVESTAQVSALSLAETSDINREDTKVAAAKH
jgi:hypothetical protein